MIAKTAVYVVASSCPTWSAGSKLSSGAVLQDDRDDNLNDRISLKENGAANQHLPSAGRGGKFV
jgi:hypothetical protein